MTKTLASLAALTALLASPALAQSYATALSAKLDASGNVTDLVSTTATGVTAMASTSISASGAMTASSQGIDANGVVTPGFVFGTSPEGVSLMVDGQNPYESVVLFK